MPKSGWDAVIENSSQEVVTMPQPPHFEEVPLSRLTIDGAYQREIIPAHLKKIRDTFEEAQLGVLEVSRRNSGEYAVFDGQHRLVVLRERQRDVAPCIVHSGLTPQQEAELFRKLQDNRKPLTPLDKYKSRLFAGDPIAKGIQVIADQLGYKVGTGPGNIQAIVVVERVYRRGNLYDTLDTMGIWAGDAKQMERALIDAVSRFLELYPEADNDRVRTQWMSVSPTIILRRSAEYMSSAAGSKAYGCLEVLRDLYTNRQNPLPSVAHAQEQRARARSGGKARYRRYTGVEVRDAILSLHDAKKAAGDDPPLWTIDELREELGGISRPALVRKGAHIDKFLERGMIRRVRAGSTGSYSYEYIPPDRQKSQRKSNANGGGGPRITSAKAVAGTGKPKRRPGSRDVMPTRKG